MFILHYEYICAQVSVPARGRTLRSCDDAVYCERLIVPIRTIMMMIKPAQVLKLPTHNHRFLFGS